MTEEDGNMTSCAVLRVERNLKNQLIIFCIGYLSNTTELTIRNFETNPPPQTQTIHISQCLRDVFLSIYESFACTSFHIVV